MLCILPGGEPTILDVTIANQMAPSHLANGRTLNLANTVENKKQSKHGANVARAGLQFVPFGLTAWGGFGPRAKAFVSSVYNKARDIDIDPPFTVRIMIRIIQMALFRGNGWVQQGARARGLIKNPCRWDAGGDGSQGEDDDQLEVGGGSLSEDEEPALAPAPLPPLVRSFALRNGFAQLRIRGERGHRRAEVVMRAPGRPAA